MTPFRLLAIICILVATTLAWMVLAGALSIRTAAADAELSSIVADNWGKPMQQLHPEAFYIAPTAAQSKRKMAPEQSRVAVAIESDPRKKGLLWYRTYTVDFSGDYLFRNPAPIAQTIYIRFDFPSSGMRFDRFAFEIGEEAADQFPEDGKIIESVVLDPGEEVTVRLSYLAAGMDRWSYSFGEVKRVRDVDLVMTTNFSEIDIPEGTESPTEREELKDGGWKLLWNYTDVIGARAIAMEMPSVTNPGPVAARITYFAPVSLVLFFAVLVILGTTRGVNLHPMNYFFLAAGCFAFQLLFAYLVDLLPVLVAFFLSAAVSLLLVGGYLWAVAGNRFARLALIAQFAYMVLFSYSFFFDGLTGITITVGSIVTLGLLMAFTAKIDWSEIFSKSAPKAKAETMPPPLEQGAT
ncbi:MAG: inner membrane CreD family protein [Verrucomicrobiota bacterium]